MEAKKKRGCNYTAIEKEMLLDLIKKYKHVIENKETNGPMILKKREAWNFVCQQYNAVAVSGFRKWHQLRHLYENLKQRSKKNNAKTNRVRHFENTKELLNKASNDKEDTCRTCGRAYKSTLTEQDAKISAMAAPKIEPLPNPSDDAPIYLVDAEPNENDEDEASELIIINSDKTDELTITTVHQESNKPQSSTSEISGEMTAQTQPKRKPKDKESNVILQYFRAKLRNARIENIYLINKTKMDTAKYKIEMEILKTRLNKLKCVRNRKH